MSSDYPQFPSYQAADPAEGPGCGHEAHGADCLCDVHIPAGRSRKLYRGHSAYATVAEWVLWGRGNIDPSSLDIMEQMLVIRDEGDRLIEMRERMAQRPDLPYDPIQEKRDARFLNLLRWNVPTAKAARMCKMERGEYVPISAGEGRYYPEQFKAVAASRKEKQNGKQGRRDEMIRAGASTASIVLATGYGKASVNSRRHLVSA